MDRPTAKCEFGESIFLFYLSAVTFSAVITLVMIQIPKIPLITYIGQNTLLYVGIHIPILRIFEKLWPDIFSDYKYSIPFAFVLYFGIAVFCALCNRFCPYVCGKEQRKQVTWVEKVIKITLVAFGAAVPYGKVLEEFHLWKAEWFLFFGCILFLMSWLFVTITEKKFKVMYLE